jgi:hypothetical protein
MSLKFFLISILIALSALSLFAGGNGTYDFLRNDVSARAAALGGSFVTMTDDPNMIFYNPSSLATLSGKRVSVGYFKHLLDINSGYASFGTDISGLGHIGAGVVYINYGEFPWRGEENQDLGTFGAGELSMSVGYGNELREGFLYGVNVKFIYSSIAEVSSSGVALDFGVQYMAVPNRILLGASLLNLGTQLDPYMNTRESLPLDLKIGMSIFPEHLPVVLLIDLHKLNENQDKFSEHFQAFSVGAEFFPSPNVQLRVGFNNERRKEWKIGSSSGMAGFSFGGGIITEKYTVDYAYNSYGSIGGLNRISVGLSF